MTQGLPPLSSRSVFTVSASITIDAPRDTVWQVLMDWGSYHEWNPFVRNQCLTDPSRKPLAASQQTPRAGAHLFIYPVHIPPSFESPKIFPASSTFQMITNMDPDNYRCAWESIEYPTWVLSTMRWQALVEVVEDGRKKTRYESVEVFDGLLAYLIRIFVGQGLRAGVTAMAEGLKKSHEMIQTPHNHMHVQDDSFTVYDTHGRQKNYVESVAQRKERIEFLKQREWIRRVTEWVRETNAQKDLSIFGRSARSHFPLAYHDAGVTSAIPFPCVEEEEEEPYVIYSSSPSSSLSSLSEEITPVLPLNSGPSLPIPQRRTSGHHRRCSSASLRGHTRKQSLSSIYEVPEED